VFTVLGIEVSDQSLRRWTHWLAPDPQPFFVGSAAEWPGKAGRRDEISTELNDTYQLWRVPQSLEVVWLSEEEFQSLPRERRATLVRSQVRNGREVPTVKGWSDLIDGSRLRAQADGHRFVWWPELVEVDLQRTLARVASRNRLASRHKEVAAATWQRCAAALPGAHDLAGTFPSAGGPNCFSTVMAAAGVTDTPTVWSETEPFDTWLDASTVRGGRDSDVGTVYMWRTLDGCSVHAAIGIGDGWALEKPSRDWHSPRGIVAVADLVRANTYRGQRLSRHRLY